MRQHHLERLARDQEHALGQDRAVLLPVGEAGLGEGRRCREPGIGDDDVDPAEPLDRAAQHLAHRRLVRHVGGNGMDQVVTRGLHQRPLGLAERLAVEVGDHDAGALGEQPPRHRPADPAGAAGHQRHPPRQRLGLGQALQLRLLEQPVLDVERLLLGQADIAVDAGGAAHDVDRVDVELGGDPRRGLVAGEGQHADARDEVDDGIRVAHGRAVGMPAAFVVGSVVPTVAVDQPVERGIVGVGRHHQRANLGAQEVIGAGGAESRQLLEPVRVHELQDRRRGFDMADLRLAGRDPAAQSRQQPSNRRLTLGLW